MPKGDRRKYEEDKYKTSRVWAHSTSMWNSAERRNFLIPKGTRVEMVFNKRLLRLFVRSNQCLRRDSPLLNRCSRILNVPRKLDFRHFSIGKGGKDLQVIPKTKKGGEKTRLLT